MAENKEQKRRIIEELDLARGELAVNATLLRQQLNLPSRVSGSFRKHSRIWVVVAAFFGWIISRLPSRKRTVYIDTAKHPKAESRRSKWSGHLWNGFWAVARPLITGYLTKRLAAQVGVEI